MQSVRFLELRVLIVKDKEKEERGSGLWRGGKVCGLELWEIIEKSVIEKVHEKKEGQQVGPVYVMIVTKPEETWLYPQDSYW